MFWFLVLSLWAAPSWAAHGGVLLSARPDSACFDESVPPGFSALTGLRGDKRELFIGVPGKEAATPDRPRHARLFLYASNRQKTLAARAVEGGPDREIFKVVWPEFKGIQNWLAVLRYEIGATRVQIPFELAVARHASGVGLLDPTAGCYRSAPPRIVSRKYFNPDRNVWSTINFKSQAQDTENVTAEKDAGLIAVDENGDSSSAAWAGDAMYTFYTSKSYVKENENDWDIERQFQLAPGLAAYVVESETEHVVPARVMKFDGCGKLTVTSGEVTTESTRLRSYNLMVVDPARADDTTALNEEMKIFKTLNTCGD